LLRHLSQLRPSRAETWKHHAYLIPESLWLVRLTNTPTNVVSDTGINSSLRRFHFFASLLAETSEVFGRSFETYGLVLIAEAVEPFSIRSSVIVADGLRRLLARFSSPEGFSIRSKLIRRLAC
jgi:hypothetical protein